MSRFTCGQCLVEELAERKQQPEEREHDEDHLVAVIMAPKRPMPTDAAPMDRRYCSSELPTTMTTRPKTSVARPVTRSAIQLTLKRRLSCRVITARLA